MAKGEATRKPNCIKNVQSEAFSISLENLKKEDEYVACFTGTRINHATIEIAFESDFVQEREKPL